MIFIFITFLVFCLAKHLEIFKPPPPRALTWDRRRGEASLGVEGPPSSRDTWTFGSWLMIEGPGVSLRVRGFIRGESPPPYPLGARGVGGAGAGKAPPPPPRKSQPPPPLGGGWTRFRQKTRVSR